MVTRSYKELKEEHKKLLVEMEVAKSAEREAAILEVREKVAEFDLTEKDVFARRKRVGGDATASKKTRGVPLYKHPNDGRTWTGKGPAPAWMVGKNFEEFRIQPE